MHWNVPPDALPGSATIGLIKGLPLWQLLVLINAAQTRVMK